MVVVKLVGLVENMLGGSKFILRVLGSRRASCRKTTEYPKKTLRMVQFTTDKKRGRMSVTRYTSYQAPLDFKRLWRLNSQKVGVRHLYLLILRFEIPEGTSRMTIRYCHRYLLPYIVQLDR